MARPLPAMRHYVDVLYVVILREMIWHSSRQLVVSSMSPRDHYWLTINIVTWMSRYSVNFPAKTYTNTSMISILVIYLPDRSACHNSVSKDQIYKFDLTSPPCWPEVQCAKSCSSQWKICWVMNGKLTCNFCKIFFIVILIPQSIRKTQEKKREIIKISIGSKYREIDFGCTWAGLPTLQRHSYINWTMIKCLIYSVSKVFFF